MYVFHLSKAKKISLIGRDVYPMVGFDGIKSDRMTFGIAKLFPKQKMPPHKHIKEEEIIYIIKGFGKLYIGNDIIESLEPGVVIVAPLNVEHYIVNESRNEMVWCFCFNPPVKIGQHAVSEK
ncbi:MAG: cupin domain-containing protein [Eubacteriales bacterium]